MDDNAITNLSPIEIQQYQQNRYPCFFLDFVEVVVPGKHARGHKNFTYNEWFFPAHFVDEPNVPGFVMVEALTQLFLMTFLTLPGNKGKKTGFVSIDKANFKRAVVPGDRLDIRAELISFRRGLARGTSSGYVAGNLACTVDLLIAVPDVLNSYKPVIR